MSLKPYKPPMKTHVVVGAFFGVAVATVVASTLQTIPVLVSCVLLAVASALVIASQFKFSDADNIAYRQAYIKDLTALPISILEHEMRNGHAPSVLALIETAILNKRMEEKFARANQEV